MISVNNIFDIRGRKIEYTDRDIEYLIVRIFLYSIIGPVNSNIGAWISNIYFTSSRIFDIQTLNFEYTTFLLRIFEYFHVYSKLRVRISNIGISFRSFLMIHSLQLANNVSKA